MTKKILVTNTAKHPAQRIPPGGTGEVDERVVSVCGHLEPVRASSRSSSKSKSDGGKKADEGKKD